MLVLEINVAISSTIFLRYNIRHVRESVDSITLTPSMDDVWVDWMVSLRGAYNSPGTENVEFYIQKNNIYFEL